MCIVCKQGCKIRVLGLFTMAVHWQLVVGADLRCIVPKLSDSLDTWLSLVNLHIKYKLSTLYLLTMYLRLTCRCTRAPGRLCTPRSCWSPPRCPPRGQTRPPPSQPAAGDDGQFVCSSSYIVCSSSQLTVCNVIPLPGESSWAGRWGSWPPWCWRRSGEGSSSGSCWGLDNVGNINIKQEVVFSNSDFDVHRYTHYLKKAPTRAS